MRCKEWEIRILRRQAGDLNAESEAELLRHLETCARCRTAAGKFAKIDRLLAESPDPVIPAFLNSKIAALVIEDMGRSSSRSHFRHFGGLLAHFRPALAGIILVVGVGLGVLIGLNLSHTLNTGSSATSYDVLAFSGIGGAERNSSLDFLWTDTTGGGR